MTEQNPNPQDDAGDGREPPRVQQRDGAPRREEGGSGRGRASRDQAPQDRDQVRNDPLEPHDESRLG